MAHPARSLRLKKIEAQVIVITGASSGIGLATAQLAARRGAKVVLSSRNGEDLARLCEGIRQRGGTAVPVVADVTDPDALKHVADAAEREFGGFDTWINNAGISSYGRLTEMHLDEKRRIFDVNFWGVVHGCRAAVPGLRKRGGAIINVGSVVSKRAIPIQGIYSASKHAVKAYTDALRMELEEAGCPISVTLVKPGAIDTPYVDHARNHLPGRATHMPPVYAPEVVARAILRCAERPTRDLFVGGAAKLYSLLETFFPSLTDKMMEKTMVRGQYRDEPRADDAEEGLFKAPAHEGRTYGSYKGRVRKHSAYTFASQRPGWTFGGTGLFGVLALAGWALGRRSGRAVRPRDESEGSAILDSRELLRRAA